MINLQNLSFSYTKKHPLFSGLNLKLGHGVIAGLLGPNGAGKTTLFKLLSGLAYPTAGVCKVMGMESRKRLPALLSRMYFLPEEIYIPLLKVPEFVRLYSPFYPDFSELQFDACMEEFGLEPDVNMATISHGQKKKVLISFALATNAKLLLLDEPTNGLDIHAKSRFRKLIANAVSEDRTILIATHQVRDLGVMIDPVIILNNSELTVHPSPPDLETFYLQITGSAGDNEQNNAPVYERTF
jgi:ABC-2 type transport system ATP-binding protein